MNTSDLENALNGYSSAQTLADKISKEVEEYKLLLKKAGSSIPLRFNEDKGIFPSNSSIRKLLKETFEGALSNAHLAYICDCLTLGERVLFESDDLKDLIFDLADPEINGGFKTPEEIAYLLNKLG
ncbi:MAG TPA: hypothetical protein VGQ53_11645 [Chitinophagaceae bacterium]|jgi:hypothetical protein|nr:hypothetical protein [Chitinophagaceae bacterium]